MAGYIVPRQFTCPWAVTHPSSNRAQCWLTTLIEANALTTTLCWICIGVRARGAGGLQTPLTRAKPLFFGQKPAAKNEKNYIILCLLNDKVHRCNLVSFPYCLYCCYANYCFLSFFSHLVEFQVRTYLSLDIVETYWAVNQYRCLVIPPHNMKC